jgi:hypothetical protein
MDDSKLQKNEKNEKDCSKLSVDGKTIREIALDRCDSLIERYGGWKKQNHLRSDVARSTALILTGITPVLLLIQPDDPKIIVIAAATSALAAIATGLLAIFGWRENYTRYGYVWHALQTEKYRYLTKATKEYWGCDKEATRYFASRIEQLIIEEVTEWRAEVERVAQTEPRPQTENKTSEDTTGATQPD